MDLVIRDGSRVGTVYFLMSEENIRKEIAQPWVSFGSDAGVSCPGGGLSPVEPASPGLWHLRAGARQILA